MLPLLWIHFGLVSPSSHLYASCSSGQCTTDQVVNLPAGLDTSPQPSARFGLRLEYVCDNTPDHMTTKMHDPTGYKTEAQHHADQWNYSDVE